MADEQLTGLEPEAEEMMRAATFNVVACCSGPGESKAMTRTLILWRYRFYQVRNLIPFEGLKWVFEGIGIVGAFGGFFFAAWCAAKTVGKL